ncbi:hypothetical protein [Candidatus Rhodoluna planktonica]|jgi:hypothetical protein|uniref:Antibiotic biosynthesis monooxygenase n=1 Tax=Candidatus Rhodoluna planktonica TaxID=535712 RepID=A0A1D9DZB1_9MICO|nr:hypothetical protein [Candidatus Rhodoluna planktonica]AOY56147.1 hypothetical protein A4Z71_04035 [Candidatus Rhodoluna planktonica]
MIAASFIFQPNNTQGDFELLDNQIMAFTESIPEYLGKTKWVSPDGAQTNVIYYFETKAALQQLMQFETHKVAKSRNSEWYDGYRVEIYEVISQYGQSANLSRGNHAR